MARYLLIETGTTWESLSVADVLEMVTVLANTGNQVDLFLIQNAVLMAYEPLEPRMALLVDHPEVTVWVDDFSLAGRAMTHALHRNISIAGAATLVSLLVRPDCRATWHSG